MMRVYTLNSEITSGGTQAAWLSGDLAANKDRVRHLIVSYHACIRPHTSSKTPQTGQYDAWAKVFYDNGVDLVIENDSHVMKRTQPIKPFITTDPTDLTQGYIAAPTDPKAAVYVGEGCWGAPLKAADKSYPWTLASARFNGFEYYQVTWESIVLRTVKIQTVDVVVETTEANPFVLPAGITLWDTPPGHRHAHHPRGRRPAVTLKRLPSHAGLQRGRHLHFPTHDLYEHARPLI